MNKTLIFFGLALLLITLFACKKEGEKITPAEIDCTTVSYSVTIAPLVAASCGGGSCHGSGANAGDLTSYSALKAFVDNGSIRAEVIDQQTMPRGSNSTADQLGQWECWLNDGAPDN